MPELPEVELISRSLDSLVRGRTIRSARLLRPRLAPGSPADDFASDLAAVTINFVKRRGKNILFDLSRGKTLMVHLRMSGRFSLLHEADDDPKFAHAIFYLDNDERLVFDDQRHFGFMKIMASADVHTSSDLARLAPEPFSDDFSPAYLYAKAKRSGRSLKEFLLDQSKVCGLGNIYACEAMFLARLDPKRPARRLTKAKAASLHTTVRAVLRSAIDHAGAREVDPSNLEGSYFSGSGEAGWFVYGREDEPCVECHNPLTRLKQGGRSTYYCRLCQKG